MQYCAELVAATHRVTLVALSDDLGGGSGYQIERNQRAWGAVIHAHYTGRGARTRVQRWIRRRRAWRAAIRMVDWSSADLIHAHVLLDGGVLGAGIGARRGLPLVVTEHSHRYFRPFPVTHWPDLWLARRAARRAARVLPVSESLRRAMEARGLSANYTVVPNVVNDALFFPEDQHLSGRAYTFVHVSDFTPNKNFAHLLGAFKKLAREYPGVRLHFAGNDHLVAAKRIAGIAPDADQPPAADPLHTQLLATGPHTREEIAELLRAADCFVLASTHETQSIVLVEALLSGLSCLASRSGGPEDTLAGVPSAATFDPGDETQLYELMRARYLAGPLPQEDRRMIAAAARKRFGRAAVANRLNQIYHHALTHHA